MPKEASDVLELLVIADDLTGALDASVQLSLKGYRVAVTQDCTVPAQLAQDYDVLTIDTETRHVSSRDAYTCVYNVAKRAQEHSVAHFYKKCDSGLRGNVGSELTALLDATGAAKLNFVPAYPALGRVTRDGVQYVDEKPLAESVFAYDPLNAVTASKVADIIAQESQMATYDSHAADRHGIMIYDCADTEELRSIGSSLEKNDGFRVAAGCAGLLGTYPAPQMKHESVSVPQLNPNLTVVSGSVNSVTVSQLDYAQQQGFPRLHVPLDQIMQVNWNDTQINCFTDRCIEAVNNTHSVLVDSLGDRPDQVTTVEKSSTAITDAMGQLAAILEARRSATLMVVGGDTLASFFSHSKIRVLEPMREIVEGVVLTRFRGQDGWQYVITKSGAFSGRDVFCKILSLLQTQREGMHDGIRSI